MWRGPFYLEDSNCLLLLLCRKALAVEGSCHVGHDADILLCAEGLPDAQLGKEVLKRGQIRRDAVHPWGKIDRTPA